MGISEQFMQRMADVLPEEEFARMFMPDGTARQSYWECDDGWVVGWTTERIQYGPHDGKFAAMAYKPIGKGARSGNAEQHERVYFRAFNTRKMAKARAEALYQQHSRERARP